MAADIPGDIVLDFTGDITLDAPDRLPSNPIALRVRDKTTVSATLADQRRASLGASSTAFPRDASS